MKIEHQLRALHEGLVSHGMTVGPVFATMPELVLKHGQPFTRHEIAGGRWRNEMRACYGNSFDAARTGQYIYVEGYAVGRVGWLPQHHAWVTDPKNTTVAYDPTWTEGAEYFGVMFRLEYIVSAFKKYGHPGVIDAWEHGWPLLSGVDRIEDAVWTPD